jgi:uncharacterized membrane-anchored protein
MLGMERATCHASPMAKKTPAEPDLKRASPVPPYFSFAPHPNRGAVLAEVHARPFHPVVTPLRIQRFAFMTDFTAAARDRAALTDFCQARGFKGPVEGVKHCIIKMADGLLRWEQHSEFTTYTFEVDGADRFPFERPAAVLAHVMRELPQPGPHLVSADLHLVNKVPEEGMHRVFDPASLATSRLDGGLALAATDFKVSSDGFVRMLVVNKGMAAEAAGALTQRLLEIETYRTLALLGLPEAQALAPAVKQVEDSLTEVAAAMTTSEGLETNHRLLNRLMRVAAQLEADTTRSGYRFSATRAYEGIVNQRLESLREEPVEGYPTFAAFLARRMGPALRTCQMMEERQSRLADKVARTANLLRTRVYVDLEEQNRDVMKAMNERTRLQLRMQQTVEGLSVAAVSYYVLGLLGYLFKALKDGGVVKIDSNVLTGIAVVPVVLAVAWAVRRIRKAHSEHE